MSSGARVSPVRTEGPRCSCSPSPLFVLTAPKSQGQTPPGPAPAPREGLGRDWRLGKGSEGGGGCSPRWRWPGPAVGSGARSPCTSTRPSRGGDARGDVPRHQHRDPGQHRGSPKCPTWRSLPPPAPSQLLGTSGAFPAGPDESRGAGIPARGRNQGPGGLHARRERRARQELSRARRQLRAQEFGADRRAPAAPLWYFGLGLEAGARLGHTGLPCSAHSSAPCRAGGGARISPKCPCLSPGQGTPGDPQGTPGDTRRWGQPLPEVLLCSRNSICSLCPLFSASARGTGHWGSPVAHVTAAPQKTRACVSARSLVVTAAHRACGRAGRAGGELRACPRGCGSRGGGETPGEDAAGEGAGERGRVPPCRHRRGRTKEGEKVLELANPSLKEPGVKSSGGSGVGRALGAEKQTSPHANSRGRRHGAPPALVQTAARRGEPHSPRGTGRQHRGGCHSTGGTRLSRSRSCSQLGWEPVGLPCPAGSARPQCLGRFWGQGVVEVCGEGAGSRARIVPGPGGARGCGGTQGSRRLGDNTRGASPTVPQAGNRAAIPAGCAP